MTATDESTVTLAEKMARPLPEHSGHSIEALRTVIVALECLKPAQRARVLMAAWVFFIRAGDDDAE